MMRLEVVVPDEMLGEVIADLTFAAGKDLRHGGPTSKGTLIHARRLRRARTYAPELRSLTKGMGYFTMEITGSRKSPPTRRRKVLRSARGAGKDEPKPPARQGRAWKQPDPGNCAPPGPVLQNPQLSEQMSMFGGAGAAAKSVAVPEETGRRRPLRRCSRRSTRRPGGVLKNYAAERHHQSRPAGRSATA